MSVACILSIPEGLNDRITKEVRRRGLDNRQQVILIALDKFFNEGGAERG